MHEFTFDDLATWTLEDCGDQTASFFLPDFTAFPPDLIQFVEIVDNLFELQFNYNENDQLAGTYEIIYAVYFEEYIEGTDYYKVQ